MYNYKKIAMSEYDLAHSAGIVVGEIIPDFEVFTLNGEVKKISECYDKTVILETGSISCGMFVGQVENMEKIAKDNPDFNFLVLYVREAHPGAKISPHSNISDKCELANRLLKVEPLNRTIIIDDLEGTFHKKLGALPNMIFIINTRGMVVYKNTWNKANVLKKALNKYRVAKSPILQKWSFMPIPSVRIEFRVFKRTGWDAAVDLIVALPKLVYAHIMVGICTKYPGLCKK